MKSFLFLCITLLPLIVFSQSEWQEYYKNESITIDYRYADCHDNQNGTHKQYVFLKITNHTANVLEIDFDKELWYNEKCTTCEHYYPEHHVSLILKPHTSNESSCVQRFKALQIFSKMLDIQQSELTRFELKNITVTVSLGK